MSAEYSGKIDAAPDLFTKKITTKTVPVFPRPLRRTQDRIRAQNLTGDPSGSSPTDDGTFWSGDVASRRQTLEAQQAAKIALDAAIDQAWYD